MLLTFIVIISQSLNTLIGTAILNYMPSIYLATSVYIRPASIRTHAYNIMIAICLG